MCLTLSAAKSHGRHDETALIVPLFCNFGPIRRVSKKSSYLQIDSLLNILTAWVQKSLSFKDYSFISFLFLMSLSGLLHHFPAL
ncbi:hypothetical protein GDO86_015343 [Hymenochirus boettgeri]|uniref:Uncharacterized protein n=1 Tax=Hymenochirus boettgeri TaxID=247094 RepID=A0A8T2JXV9_9PIPI|nr:hypothetical protein GDO86_015343 [Hymenochirus boettgeri]